MDRELDNKVGAYRFPYTGGDALHEYRKKLQSEMREVIDAQVQEKKLRLMLSLIALAESI